jgi:hypothetical protein
MGAREGKGGNYHREGNKWNTGVAVPTSRRCRPRLVPHRYYAFTLAVSRRSSGTNSSMMTDALMAATRKIM